MKKSYLVLLAIPAFLVSCSLPRTNNDTPTSNGGTPTDGTIVDRTETLGKFVDTLKKVDTYNAVGIKVENATANFKADLKVYDVATPSATATYPADKLTHTEHMYFDVTDLDFDTRISGLTATNVNDIKGSVDFHIKGSIDSNAEVFKVKQNIDSSIKAYISSGMAYIDASGVEAWIGEYIQFDVTSYPKFSVPLPLQSEDLPLIESDEVEDELEDVNLPSVYAALNAFAECKVYDDNSYTITLDMNKEEAVALFMSSTGLTTSDAAYSSALAYANVALAGFTSASLTAHFDADKIYSISTAVDIANLIAGNDNYESKDKTVSGVGVITYGLKANATVNFTYGSDVVPATVTSPGDYPVNGPTSPAPLSK